jgi:tetratricopeptide (TPR) repeat protein
MEACRALVRSGSASRAEVGYFVNMRGRHVLDTRDWTAAARLDADVDHPGYHFVSGYAALQRGDDAGARAALEALQRAFAGNADPRGTIMRLELEALLALRSGGGARAVALLREAADLEESLPFEFGPPASLTPPHELLGEGSLELGDPATALAACRKALEFTPERAPSLMGLAESAEALDQLAAASDARARLEQMRRGSN